MKIAFLSSGSPSADQYPPKGGIQYQIYHTAKTVQQLGHDPIIITRDQEDPLPQNLQFRSISAPLDDEIVSRLFFSRRAAEEITEIDPDLVLAYERFSAVFPVRLNYPVLFFTSNYDAMEFYRDFAVERNQLNRIVFPVKKRLEETVMQKADRVIALNPGIQDYLQTRGISHTQVIPNGVDVTSYQNNGNDGFIFYAGRLNEVKGVRFLLEAVNEVQNQFPDIELRITGDGEQREFLEQRVRELNLRDHVHFTGWVDRPTLHEYFSRCSMFVLPSDFETFGIVVLEAMASGKPVIASNIRGPRDIVTSGKDGLLVEPRNVEQLRTAISSLLQDEEQRARFGQTAQETVENKYSFPVITRQILTVCESIIS